MEDKAEVETEEKTGKQAVKSVKQGVIQRY
jgi:hypothetical protein